jgi:hypothetical protein
MTHQLSTEDAFAAGDYMGVALSARPDHWQYHAARGLIADPRAGRTALAGFDHVEARFYAAVLAWMCGDEDRACLELEHFDGAHANNLLALIRKPRLKVLSMLPPVRHGAFVLREGIRSDPKFDVRNVGVFSDDVPTRPYAGIADYVPSLNWPDLFVSLVMEWHQIPIDLQRLPCPTIGFTNDFDLHIQGLRQWFDPFDVRVVIDHVYEWPTLRAIAGGPTLSCPLVFGVSDTLPPVDDRVRDIDVMFSGTLVSAYNPEKEKLLRDLLQIPGLNLALLDGHVADAPYFELIARSKITPSFCRHRGGIQTRVIETLSMGSISLVQPDSIMKVWADRNTGLWEYDESIGPGPQIREILADYERYARPCIERAPVFRSFFDARSVASRFFRFCTFAAAMPRGARVERTLTQKRVMFAHGPSLPPAAAVDLAERNAARMLSLPASAATELDAAREWLLLYARALYDNRASDLNPRHLSRAIDGYRSVVDRYPRNLVARFNLFRALLHLGTPDQQLQARTVLAETLAASAGGWDVDPADDILPYDFMPEWFNYRKYLDLVVDAHTGATDAIRMGELILASLHHYRAVAERSLADARRAVELDAAFTPYRLTLGERLADADEHGAVARAAEILADLADGSNVGLRAYRLLRSLAAIEGVVGSEVLTRAEAVAERVRLSLLQTEHYHLKVVSPYFVRESFREGWRFGAVCHTSSASRGTPLVSIVVTGRHGASCGELLAALNEQSIPRTLYEIVYVDCYGEPAPRLLPLADVAISLNQRELLDSLARAWTLGLEEITTPLVVVLQPGRAVDERFVESILDVFYERPAIGASSLPRAIALVGGPDRLDPASPQFAAFRIADYVRGGGVDEAEAFRGDGSALTFLLECMRRSGVLVAGESAAAAPPGTWWQYDRLLEKSGRVAAARGIWPHLFNGARLSTKLETPKLLEAGASANIVRICGAYFVVPFALGAVDWKSVALHSEPPLWFSTSLAAARSAAGA